MAHVDIGHKFVFEYFEYTPLSLHVNQSEEMNAQKYNNIITRKLKHVFEIDKPTDLLAMYRLELLLRFSLVGRQSRLHNLYIPTTIICNIT